MSIKTLNPYFIFNGTAAAAIKLYESALSARTENLSRFGDVPGNKTAPENKDRVMHARLHIGGGIIMISDTLPENPVPLDGNVHVSLDFEDVADMAQKFEALAASGKVTAPLHDAFWGARFGMLTDSFGIHWMFNCERKQA